MPTKRLKQILVVDPNNTGATELLQGALSPQKIQVARTSRLKTTEAIANKPDLLFVVIKGFENDSTQQISLTERGPLPILKFVWDLVESNKFPVHILVPTEVLVLADPGFTPLDTLGLCLSGVAGVWEVGTKLAADLHQRTLQEHISRLMTYWEFKKTFLYGKPAVQLYDFNMKLSAGVWPLDDSWESEEDTLEEGHIRLCFLTALALASLTTDQLKLRDERATASMEKYAEQLLTYADYTGLQFEESTLGRPLRLLMRGWASRFEHCTSKKKYELPLWARQDGFPNLLPLVRGILPVETPEILYNILMDSLFEEWDPLQSASTLIDVSKVVRKR